MKAAEDSTLVNQMNHADKILKTSPAVPPYTVRQSRFVARVGRHRLLAASPTQKIKLHKFKHKRKIHAELVSSKNLYEI
jgi:hypothetical protein